MDNKFQSAVEATSDIKNGYKPGLQALKSNSTYVKASDNRKISGSVDIDEQTKNLYPTASRWDYAIGYDDKAYFVEVHPACNGANVKEIVNKFNWLQSWLKSKAPKLKEISSQNFYWAITGKNAIGSDIRKINQLGIQCGSIAKIG